jgi:septal ring factor EnvC (AmiA/AmiB activator)
MVDDLKEFVHERFRRTDEKLDKVVELLAGFALRLGSVERQVAGLRVDFAQLREDLVRIERRIDSSDAKLERIEKRLDLVGAGT